jgi:2-polyprenyl-3-methyl-5-hydroxy-6-metoxy-1,4-benzoquinol methylase
MIDFGAGDCAASRSLISDYGIHDITVVDKSSFSLSAAREIGVRHSNFLEQAPIVDLVFSGHSIEHVHDLSQAMKLLIEKVRIGGYLFFETPNIANQEIFQKLCLAPHTYFLSVESFHRLGKLLGLEVLAIETVGPKWSKAFPRITSDARADLRVLFLISK